MNAGSRGIFILLRLALWLGVMGALLRVCARLFFKRDPFAGIFAGWTARTAGGLQMLIVGAALGSLAPTVLPSAHGRYGEGARWALRLTAMACAMSGAALVLVGLRALRGSLSSEKRR